MPAKLLHLLLIFSLLLSIAVGCRTKDAELQSIVPRAASPPTLATTIKTLRLSETEVIQIANREVARLKISTVGFKGPMVHRPSDSLYTGRLTWYVFYDRGQFPGDHFSIAVDDEDGRARFCAGE